MAGFESCTSRSLTKPSTCCTAFRKRPGGRRATTSKLRRHVIVRPLPNGGIEMKVDAHADAQIDESIRLKQQLMDETADWMNVAPTARRERGQRTTRTQPPRRDRLCL